MAKPPPFAVLLRDIPLQDTPLHRSFAVSAERVGEWLAGLPMRDALGAPADDPEAGHGAAELDLYADGEHVFAAGTFKGDLTVACSRCVESMKIVIDDKVRVTFLPRSEMPVDEDGDEPAEDDGIQITDGDVDVFPYEGEYIDLEPLFREEFVLAIPYAPLCRDDCKGLCSQCGTDLNTGTCSCEKPVDPRLAGLKGLKLTT